ncbi:MAG: CDP-alcohol phosphatidyltransferase family protein [Synechococcaceae cyanobacterium]|nr:CDP-alcohol phosphatidyltransferase family protein [Synechococcaceae cyanobacterium]
MLPTLCTLGNLVAGFAAIHYASKDPALRVLGDWTPLSFAGALIFLGLFLDAVDGSIARLTRSISDIGSQLDSLADVVTFGVAPAYLTLQLVINHLESDGWIIGPGADNVLGKVIWGAAALYVCCVALRLARFNVEAGEGGISDHMSFRGLPSPGAAGTLASLIILHQHMLVSRFGGDVPDAFVQGAALGIPLAMLLCAFAMVSSIPYVHFTNRYVRGQRSFRYIARLVILLALAVWWLQETLALVFTVYSLSGPVRLAIRWRRRARAGSDGGRAPDVPAAPRGRAAGRG